MKQDLGKTLWLYTLFIALMFTFFLTSLADEGPEYQSLGAVRQVSAGQGQALALADPATLAIYSIENGTLEKKAAPFEGFFFYDGGGVALLGFNIETYEIINLETGGVLGTINEGSLPSSDSFWFSDFVVKTETLYFNYHFDETKNQQYAYDFVTGVAQKIGESAAEAFCLYADNALLMVVPQAKNPERKELVLLDISTGKTQVKLTLSSAAAPHQLAYDEKTGTIYLLCDDGIFASHQFAPEKKVMSYSAQGGATLSALVGNRWFVVFSSSGVQVMDSQNPVIGNEELVFIDFRSYDDAFSRALHTIQGEYPGLTLVNKNFYEDYGSTQTFITDLLSNPNSFDLLFLSPYAFDLSILMDKGYCLDLSASPYLKERAEKLYPVFQEALIKEGQLLAFPFFQTPFGPWITANPSIVEQSVFTQKDLPTTYQQLLTLKQQLGTKPFGPEGRSFFGLSDHYALLQNALTAQSSVCQYQHQPIVFNTPAFRETLALIRDISDIDDDYVGDRFAELALFNASAENFDFLTTFHLPLATDPDGPALCRLEPSVFIIHSGTPNKEAALRLIEEIVKNLSDATTGGTYSFGAMQSMAMLYTDAPAEGISGNYLSQKKQYEEEKTALEEALSQSTDSKANQKLQEDIQSVNHNLALLEEHTRKYDYTQADLERYREQMLPHFYVNFNNYFTYGSTFYTDEIQPLMEQYDKGKINMDTFLTHLDQKIAMAQIENQ